MTKTYLSIGIYQCNTRNNYGLFLVNIGIKGAVNIPMDQLPHNLKKIKGKEQVIITCCASGMRSGSAKNYLKGQGYIRVYNGGSWKKLNEMLSRV